MSALRTLEHFKSAFIIKQFHNYAMPLFWIHILLIIIIGKLDAMLTLNVAQAKKKDFCFSSFEAKQLVPSCAFCFYANFFFLPEYAYGKG